MIVKNWLDVGFYRFTYHILFCLNRITFPQLKILLLVLLKTQNRL